MRIKKTYKNSTSYSDLLDLIFGKSGTEMPKKLDEGIEAFKSGVCYPFEFQQSLKTFPSSSVIPCSTLINNSIIGGFLFTCSTADLKFFDITTSTLPQPFLKFRMLNSDYKSYLIEIHLAFDNDKTLKFHLNPVHPAVRKVFVLLKNEQKIAFHFYNKKTNEMVVTYTMLDEDKLNWLIRNIKLMNTFQYNYGYQELENLMTKKMEKNDKLFKFNESKEQTFIVENSKVVKLS